MNGKYEWKQTLESKIEMFYKVELWGKRKNATATVYTMLPLMYAYVVKRKFEYE